VNIIRSIPLTSWNPGQDFGDGRLQEILESGEIPYFPELPFELQPNETRFLSAHWADPKSKNINLRPHSEVVRGAVGTTADLLHLREMLQRYAALSEQLIARLMPGYVPYMRRGGTSFRPVAVERRATSWRKDDSRLHVDAFPSNPMRGVRLLRVFSNVNPVGKPRVWRVGEPFRDFAVKFLPRTTTPLPGTAWLMHKLGITKSRRSLYDHLMLQLHDGVKADLDYQRNARQQQFDFPPGCTWLVFSDQVLHAAMAGQFMKEQTFYLDLKGLRHPEMSPLHVLEELTARKILETEYGG